MCQLHNRAVSDVKVRQLFGNVIAECRTNVGVDWRFQHSADNT
jgi:hypothetical protein